MRFLVNSALDTASWFVFWEVILLPLGLALQTLKHLEGYCYPQFDGFLAVLIHLHFDLGIVLAVLHSVPSLLRGVQTLSRRHTSRLGSGTGDPECGEGKETPNSKLTEKL